MCAVFSLWLQMGHGNTETALKVENDDDLSALQCCNTHGFAHWMRSKHFHMTPVFPVSISQWAWGAKSSFKQKPGIKLRLQILDNILFFKCFLSVLFSAAHSGRCGLCRSLRACRWNKNFKPLMKSSGTVYAPNLTKLGSSIAKYTLINSMCVRKGRNTWKLERYRKEGYCVGQSCHSDGGASAADSRGKAAENQHVNIGAKQTGYWHFPNKCDKCVKKAKTCLTLWQNMPKRHML